MFYCREKKNSKMSNWSVIQKPLVQILLPLQPAGNILQHNSLKPNQFVEVNLFCYKSPN